MSDVPANQTSGRVSIVGGGPGAPGLITVRGRELLLQADVVVVDRLAPRELLQDLGPQVRIVEAGKSPGSANVSVSQAQINAYLVEFATAGLHVVRLKGGDPLVFGRGMDELAACQAAGVAVELVPGVSSAIAVPALAGIPVTYFGGPQGFTVVSGHVSPTSAASTIDWRALAQVGTTIVLLMAVANLRAISEALLSAGMPPETPTACISDGSTAAETVVRSNLGELADAAVENEVRNPAVVVIGQAAGQLVPPPEARAGRRILILGGASSGKSAFAEKQVQRQAKVEYVATASPSANDPEWNRRILKHKSRRPQTWLTRETLDVAGQLTAADTGTALLIDSITAWLTARLDHHNAWQDAAGWRAALTDDTAALVASWATTQCWAVAVSDEVSGGIVPATASGRLFQDELGSLNQRLAADADEVWLVTAGIASRLR